MKKYYLFDLDGTLTDPRIGITTCVQYALQSFGIDEPELDKLEPFIGPPLRDSFMEFYGLSEEQAQRAIEKYRERFQDIGIFENEIYMGIPHVLKTLQSKGFFLAVASSKPEEYVLRILDHFNIRQYFAVVVGSEMDGQRVEKPEVVREALRRLGEAAGAEVQPDEVYMIGDRKFDIEGAHELGIEGVGVTYGYGGMEELKAAHADYIVQSVPELEKFLLRNAEELQNNGKPEKKGLPLSRIWVMLYSFLMFMIAKSIVQYAFEWLCVQGWDMELPGWLDSFLYARDAVTDGEGFAFTGNQSAVSTALGFIGGGLAVWRTAVLLIRKAAEDSHLLHLRRKPVRSYIALGVTTLGMVLCLNVLFELNGATDSSAAYQAAAEDQYSAAFVLGLLVYGLITPAAEELLFRGIIYNYLKRFIAATPAMILSAALFGMYHMNTVQGSYGFILGMLMAYAYKYFGQFAVPLAIHMASNLIAYCLTYTGFLGTAAVNWFVCLVFLATALLGLRYLEKHEKD